MANIPFVKATACGNDFLIVEAKHAPTDVQDFTRLICDRNMGVGADGVEWVSAGSEGAELEIRLLNADGSEAEISGNGTRCVAAWYCAEHPQEKVVIRTGAGVKTCELRARRGESFDFRSSMGKPKIGGELALSLGDGEVQGIVVATGNPHFTMFVSEFQSGWQATASQIAVHPHFPNGTNVELVKVASPSQIEVRFFERGVGETLSSGTGSCAAAVASVHTGRGRSPVQVHAPGGTQTVEWEEEIFLTGPATLLCRGEFFI